MNDDVKLYRLSDVCRILKITYPTVQNYIKTNKLRAIRFGGQWRVTLGELQRFIKQGNFEVELNLEDIDTE